MNLLKRQPHAVQVDLLAVSEYFDAPFLCGVKSDSVQGWSVMSAAAEGRHAGVHPAVNDPPLTSPRRQLIALDESTSTPTQQAGTFFIRQPSKYPAIIL